MLTCRFVTSDACECVSECVNECVWLRSMYDLPLPTPACAVACSEDERKEEKRRKEVMRCECAKVNM